MEGRGKDLPTCFPGLSGLGRVPAGAQGLEVKVCGIHWGWGWDGGTTEVVCCRTGYETVGLGLEEQRER